MFFDVQDIFETSWGSEATGGKEELVTCAVRAAGETEGVDGRDVETWGQYGFTSRPAAPDGEKRCQALTTHIAGKKIIVATRDLRGADNHGALNAGDVAVWSTGKIAVRCNADGSGGIRKQGETADTFIQVEKDGVVLIGCEWGMFQITEDGPALMHADGMSSISLGKGGNVTISGQQINLAGAVVGLGVGASVPMAIQPGSPVATIPPGAPAFFSSVPISRILVPPA